MTKRTYGMWIKEDDCYSTPRFECRIMTRENEDPHPINCRDTESSIWDAPKDKEGLAMGLSLSGHIYPYGKVPQLCGFEPTYRQPYSVDLVQAKAMAKTLDKVWKAIRKEDSDEPVDIFMAVCKSLKLDWVVIQRTDNGSRFSDSEWAFVSIQEGKRWFNRLLQEYYAKHWESQRSKAA